MFYYLHIHFLNNYSIIDNNQLEFFPTNFPNLKNLTTL